MGSGVDLVRYMPCADWKEAAGGAVFRRHVADGGTISDRKVGKSWPEKFYKFADNAALAQHLRDGKHEIGRSDALLELAGEPHADDFRQQHGIGLAKHGSLGLDAAHAPAEHGETIDHRGVGIGAHQRIGIGDIHHHRLSVDFDLVFLAPYRLRQIFEIDLVANAGARRHDAKVVERLLRPFQEFIALPVLPVFLFDILLDCIAGAEDRYRYRVIANEIDRNERIDFLRIAAEHLHGITHGGEVDDRRDASEVLHQHARGSKGDLAF